MIHSRQKILGQTYFLKLMNTEDTPSILAMRSGLFTVACAVTGIPVKN